MLNKNKVTALFEILFVSTKLGLTSFGGPVAHLGYFHDDTFAEENGWMKKVMQI